MQEDADHGISHENVKSELQSTFGVSEEEFVGMNCLNPDFLSYQLDKSRQNLGLETIDLVSLHNPENFLNKDGLLQADLYEMIGRAFER